MTLLEGPAPVGTPLSPEHIHGLGGPVVHRRPGGLEVIEGAENVVAPPRRERKPQHPIVDHLATAMGPEQVVFEQEGATPLLGRLGLPSVGTLARCVLAEAFQHGDGRVE